MKTAEVRFWICLLACALDLLMGSICVGVPQLRDMAPLFMICAAIFALSATSFYFQLPRTDTK